MREAIFDQAYQMVIRSVSLRMAGRSVAVADHEDAEQHVALGVWLALSHFNPDRGSLRTFVELVVHHQLVSFFRKTSNRAMTYDSIDDIEPASGISDHHTEVRVEIERILRRLPAFDRAVAVSLMDSKVAETSRCLRISRSSACRAVRRLRIAFVAAGMRSADRRGRL